MSIVQRFMAGVVVATAVGGCAATAPVTCAENDFDPPAALTCDAAITAARQQLSAVAGVNGLSFEYQICPANARCAFASGEIGYVIATLAGGEQLSVTVYVDPDGVVQAEEPQPLVTSEPEPGG